MIYLSKRKKFYIGFILIILITGTFQLVYWMTQKEPPIFETDEAALQNNQITMEFSASVNNGQNDNNKEEVKVMMIDIKGEVNNPGVYQMEDGERIQDAVMKAGGSKENADLNQVNLAMKVYDEMVIYVPKKGEDMGQRLYIINDGKISINQSNKEELMELNGIGESKADAIIAYRMEHGSFKSLDEIMEISGIGTKIFQQIKDKITIH